MDTARILRLGDAKIDILADQAAQHCHRLIHDPVYFKNPRLYGLASAERKQLRGEVCRALAGFQNLLDGCPVSFRSQMAGGQQHLAVAGDDGQQVIKVVGDTSREHAQTFHFLSLAQLLIQLCA